MIEESAYGFRVSLDVPYEAALERATAALKAEGFGVLATIDMQHALKEKLGRDIRRYTILGACNPPLCPATSLSTSGRTGTPPWPRWRPSRRSAS